MTLIKCIIWDLDNTVWDGVLSESGAVKLRTEIHQVLEFYQQKGIIQSICSRNDYEAARERLQYFGIWDYFIYPQISWRAKSESIQLILGNLRFRAENVLFIDDSPFERDEVQTNISGIMVNDGSNLTSLLTIEGVQNGLNSLEARERVTMYKLEEKRIQDKTTFQGNEIEFLHSCSIKINVKVAEIEDLARIKELIDRTNQINSTGIRYELAEIKQMIRSPEYMVYIVKVKDKYGSYGRSGLIILERNPGEDLYEIKLLIVSCRLMGKGIAQALLSFVCCQGRESNIAKIRCPFIRNRYNRQMILLYTMNGFELKSAQEEVYIYELQLNRQTVSLPEWIRFTEEDIEE
jgi:FkbH-like protein